MIALEGEIDFFPVAGLLGRIEYDYIEANTRQIKAKFAEIFQ